MIRAAVAFSLARVPLRAWIAFAGFGVRLVFLIEEEAVKAVGRIPTLDTTDGRDIFGVH